MPRYGFGNRKHVAVVVPSASLYQEARQIIQCPLEGTEKSHAFCCCDEKWPSITLSGSKNSVSVEEDI